MTRVFRLALPLLALFANACLSIGSYQSAHTVGDGKFQFALEPGYEGTSKDGTRVSVPRIDFAARYGITDRVDLGGKIGASGFELLGKFQLTDPASHGFVLSLAPSAGGIAIGGADEKGSASAGLLNFHLPVLIGIGVGQGGSEVVLAARLIDTLLFGNIDRDGASINVLSVGATVGFCLSLGKFKLIPEVSIAKPVLGTASVSGDSTVSKMFSGSVIYQFGVGFAFGGR